jgi:hypothetical protein
MSAPGMSAPGMNSMSTAPTAHPSPHRHRVGLAALAFGLCGGPFAWAVQFNVNYALASHACFPAIAPRGAPLPGWAGVSTVMLAINVVALVIALLALVVAWRAWQATREEHRGGSRHLLEAGEGRSRFLAACGAMAAAGFFVAMIFNTAALIWVPQCTG